MYKHFLKEHISVAKDPSESDNNDGTKVSI
jgi:hypothetical protein